MKEGQKLGSLFMLVLAGLFLTSCAAGRVALPDPVGIPGIVTAMEKKETALASKEKEQDPVWIEFDGGRYRYFIQTFGNRVIQLDPSHQYTVPPLARIIWLEIHFHKPVDLGIQPMINASGVKKEFPVKQTGEAVRHAVPFQPDPRGIMQLSALLKPSDGGEPLETQKLTFTGRQKPARKEVAK